MRTRRILAMPTHNVKACFLNLKSFAEIICILSFIPTQLAFFTLLRLGSRVFPQPTSSNHSPVKQHGPHSPVGKHSHPDTNHTPAKHDSQHITDYNPATPHAQHRNPHGVTGITSPLNPAGSTHEADQIGINKAFSQIRITTTCLTCGSWV